ncbi:MAG: DoxX family protein, partial [Mycobacterium sp.]
IIASADTAGKPSLGWRGRRAAGRVSEAVSAALPVGGSEATLLDSDVGEKFGDFGEKIGQRLQVGAERGRELAGAAGERSAPLVAVARKRGGELAETARERGPELAETALKRGSRFADTARARGSEIADTARKRLRDHRRA